VIVPSEAKPDIGNPMAVVTPATIIASLIRFIMQSPNMY
jgi:hypothetical protein